MFASFIALAAFAIQTPAPPSYLYETRTLVGWTLKIRTELFKPNTAAMDRAMELLKPQLEEIVRVVPKSAVTEMRKVTLWFSPEYPNSTPGAAYHPGAQWLKEHDRDPQMAKGVEFTNVRIFDAETRRMPNFALHELAHAYHDRVLTSGFGNVEVKAAYEIAKTSGKYDRVEKRDSEGRKSMGRHYALTNPQEFFAESTEAFFSTNDFYPYNRSDLKQYDPETYALVAKVWGVSIP